MLDQGVPYVEAHNLSLKTLRGYQYRNVSLKMERGRVLAINGLHGSGKTALLLTLAGRMKQTSGTLRVGEFSLPRQRARALRRIGLALFAGANDLQESLAVRDAVRMELELFGRPHSREDAKAYLREWGLYEVESARVKNLPAEALVRLGIALAFVGHPQVVVVDDIERELTLLQSKGLMAHLMRQARERDVAVAVGVVEGLLAKSADDRVMMVPHSDANGLPLVYGPSSSCVPWRKAGA